VQGETNYVVSAGQPAQPAEPREGASRSQGTSISSVFLSKRMRPFNPNLYIQGQ